MESKAKDAFVRYVTHEIRSPLQTVFLGLELFEKEVNKLENNDVVMSLLKLIQNIRKSCDISLTTANDMLLYDKIKDGVLHLEMKWVKAMVFIEETISPFIIQVM